MFRSIRAAKAKSRRAKSIANSRQLLLESLEQRRLLSASPGLALAPLNVTSPAAFYGPVQGGVGERAGINLRAEGEGESTPDTARQLLFAGIAGSTASPTNSGLLTIIDATPNSPTDTIVPWKAPVLSGGIAGLAFDLSGRLFAAVDQGPCTPSELVELNPADGTAIRRLPIMAGSTQINIGDLAVEPSTGKLFGTRSIRDDANHAGELFIIDVDSGAATFVGDTGTRTGEGLAFAADGALYLAGTAGGKPVLYKIDPATAEPHQRDAVTGRAIPLVVLNDPTGRLKEIEGLVGHPDNGTLIATTSMTRPAANQIVDDTYVIDLSTGKVTARPLASPARGIFGDLAFQPSPHALDIFYQENFEDGIGGFVTDNTGGTLPGLWHYSLGRRFDKLPSHTPISSFYYGAFETAFGDGHYVLPLDHEGTLTSPHTDPLPTSSVLSFNYLLDTRPELDVDFVTVSVITADGNVTQILSRADGTLPQTGRQNWRTATADLSAFACQRIQLRFSFDTGPAPEIDPEGWYLDDLMIGSTGGLCDFGDAPDDPANPNDYPTLLASNGARHGVVEGFHLGALIDSEPDGQPTALADGDDNNGLPDEDGVKFLSAVVPGELATVEVVAQGTGLVNVWIDYNSDHKWDGTDEHVFSDVLLDKEISTLTFPVPTSAVATNLTYARFRFSSQAGLSYDGFAIDGEVEDHTLKIDQPVPSITIEKSASPSTYSEVDQVIHYSYLVTNTGNVTLSGPFAIQDDKTGDEACPATGSLAPTESLTCTASYKITQVDLDAEFVTNVAIGTASYRGDLVESPPDSETVTGIVNTALTVDKTATPMTYGTVDQVIHYSYLVTNTGNVTLSAPFAIQDDTTTDEACPATASLAPMDSITCTASYKITQDDLDAEFVTNVAVASASFKGDLVESPPDSETITGIADPGLTVDKSATPSTYSAVDQVIQYSYLVTNTGNVTLSGPFAIQDDKSTDEACPATASLAPMDSITCTASYKITQGDLDAGSVTNVAVASASFKGDLVESPPDSETIFRDAPGLTVKKSATPLTYSAVDQVINYSYLVTNTGDVTLSRPFAIQDDKSTDEACPAIDSLAPTKSITCTASYTIKQSDLDAGLVTNIAVASALFNGTAVTSPPDSATVVAVDVVSGLTVKKSATPSTYSAVDQVINYSYLVTNSGDVTLSGPFTVQDDKSTDEACPATDSLAPTKSITCTASYTIKQSDLDAGLVTNIAVASALFNGTAVTSLPDSATVRREQLEVSQLIQFITPMSLFRPDGPSTKPPSDQLAITGFVWDDANNDGVWQAGEVGLNDVFVYIDQNGNGVRDEKEPAVQTTNDASGDGAYWFAKSLFGSVLPGTFTLRVDLPGATPTRFPVNARHDVTLGKDGQLFGAFQRAESPNFGLRAGAFAGTVAISGFKWHDLNQDGVWDANEMGRAGWSIYIDLNGDNIFDPVTEPLAITDSTGRYVFTVDDLKNVPNGTYAIREDSIALSAGTFQVQRFPAPDPGVRDPDEHLVEWSPGTVIQGRAGVAEAPNFGTFDYSPFIRPADDQLGHLNRLSAADKLQYLAALAPWQTIEVSNTTSSQFNVVDIDTSGIAAPGNDFVTLVDDEGNVIDLNHRVLVPKGETRTVYVFYDPAIRNSAGDTVIRQYPDWLNGAEKMYGPHTFTRDDQLTILTDSPGLSFPVKLVGGSTYDSDIFYDGAVDFLDFGRLDGELLNFGRNWPIVEGVSPLFDVTSDINARCPNGAEGDVASCVWGLQGSPAREIALGDFGTLNAEFDRARAPFLDLDIDNSSGARGTDYAAEYAGVPIPVVDIDASFANSDERVLLLLTVVAPDGDKLTIDKVKLESLGLSVSQSEPHWLVLSGADPVTQAGSVVDFASALRLILYQAMDRSVTRIAEIEFVAEGLARPIGDPEPQGAFTTLPGESEVIGNTAVARIKVIGSE